MRQGRSGPDRSCPRKQKQEGRDAQPPRQLFLLPQDKDRNSIRQPQQHIDPKPSHCLFPAVGCIEQVQAAKLAARTFIMSKDDFFCRLPVSGNHDVFLFAVGSEPRDPDSSGEGMDPFACISSNCAIVISGGQNTIAAAGDGIDSNGSLTVSGGTTFVSGPENGSNFALDYDTDGVFEGGTFLACGMSGMVQTLSSSSPSIMIASDQGKDTNITLEQNGRSVLSFKASHAFDTLLVYDSGFQTGDEVCILDETITLSGGQNTIGNVQSMNSRLPGQPMGGGPQDDGRPNR